MHAQNVIKKSKQLCDMKRADMAVCHICSKLQKCPFHFIIKPIK